MSQQFIAAHSSTVLNDFCLNSLPIPRLLGTAQKIKKQRVGASNKAGGTQGKNRSGNRVGARPGCRQSRQFVAHSARTKSYCTNNFQMVPRDKIDPATALVPGQGADLSAVRREVSQNQKLLHKKTFKWCPGTESIRQPRCAPRRVPTMSAVRREISQNHKVMRNEIFNGAQGQNRTADTGIFSPLLYRLSYLGIRSCAKRVLDPNPAAASSMNTQFSAISVPRPPRVRPGCQMGTTEPIPPRASATP